ncbi:phage head-tail connector protein [Fructobacillus fructosus]|uniref:phage head-tail connector protein n=1 Tax=Fructobacillus fructosus TaxID=1631 RepID=UPI002D82B428|nr:hypothetical protein LMG30235_GOPAMIKF_00671 [Fructobacillus fructosus]CAK1236299.1 hypothetical protein R54866_LGPIEIPA_00672 [Fructobacillus fructosus]CAK1237570.1 hypothetical protein LMG30234_GAICNKDF_00732 [Fructobacillus fructosus]
MSESNSETKSNYAKLLDPKSTVDEKLEIIEKNVKARLSVLLGIKTASIPDQFNYIVDEVVAARFSRIGNEGMKSSGQDGLTLVFQDDDFSKFKNEIDEYRTGNTTGRQRGRVMFL